MSRRSTAPIVREFGMAGHFCAAHHCRYHRHTHVGRFCISTVGDYHPPLPSGMPTEKPQQVGSGRFFETMVFDLKKRRHRWHSLAMVPYQSVAKADAGHARVVSDYVVKCNRAARKAKAR